MKYNKLFSYCLKNEKPDNVHQFHYIESDEEPTTLEWENWIAGKLYSNILIQNNRNAIHLDLSDGKDKKEQLRAFFDYHYSKYGDICFLYEIKELMNLFETSLRNYYKINSDYLELVNGMIRDWCKEKEQIPKASTTNAIAPNNQDPLNLEDLLINIPDEKKTEFLKRLSAIIQKRNKPKEFAIVLVALSQMGHIELTTGGRNRIYRVFYKESGYDRSFNAFVSGINHNIEEKGNAYTVLNSNQTDIENIINALA